MVISMRVNAISFTGKQERLQRQQEFDAKRDQMLDMALLQMLPEFMNGEADVLMINSKSEENGEINMNIDVRQRQPKSEFSEEAMYLYGHDLYQEVPKQDVIEVEPKKGLFQKLKDIFRK
jgi:hypothetical protein